MIIEKILSIFKSNLPPDNDVIQNELSFSMVSEIVIVYKIAPWEGPALTNLFQKVKNEHFLNPNLDGLFRGSF